MHDFTGIRKKFSEQKCCVIIPTYNNDKTLEMVIRDVENYTNDIIIVNDGSTDNTPVILEKFRRLHILTHPENMGKGMALRNAFSFAVKKGFRYAITIDSDGQHFPADLPAFIDWIEKDPDSLIVGARNMDQSDVPGTSSFGHKFSIFWYKVETGLKIPDVQSGYRLYPIALLKDVKFYTRKFEFEVEVLVRAAWKGIRILALPVNVYYAPKDERVSHFRKFRDFTRISILNTLLVFIALLWVRPVQFLKEIRKKSIRQFIRDHVLESKDSNMRLAFSVAIGLFIGVTPVWGWQMMIAFGTAHLFKLNKFVTIAASNISIPPLLPVILFLSYIFGGFLLGSHGPEVQYNPGFSMHWVKENLLQYLIGSAFFGICLATAGGTASYILLTIFRKKHNVTAQEQSGSIK